MLAEPIRQLRLIRAKHLIEFFRRRAEDAVGDLALRVALDVNFPQIFVQLRQRDLDGGLRRVDVNRRQPAPGRAPRHGELVGEHEFHQLGQYAVLGAENVLERAVRNIGLFDDLRQRGLLIPLFEEQPHADGQDALFRRQACAGDGDNISSFTVWCIHQHYIMKCTQTQQAFCRSAQNGIFAGIHAARKTVSRETRSKMLHILSESEQNGRMQKDGIC